MLRVLVQPSPRGQAHEGGLALFDDAADKLMDEMRA
jgi:hypothetical protein